MVRGDRGNKLWYWADAPKTPLDPEGARKLLASIGLVDRNGDGVLDDAANRPARFALLTQKGRPALERGSAVIRDELKKIGLVVDVVPLDANALIQRLLSAKYDAIYFNPDMTDTDRPLTPTSGSARERGISGICRADARHRVERQIDELMTRQIASPDEAERKRLFVEVQKIFADQRRQRQHAVFAARRGTRSRTRRIVEKERPKSSCTRVDQPVAVLRGNSSVEP